MVSPIRYTNACETTLFNLLTSEHKETSSSLFAPPWTTTKCLKVDDQKTTLLLTDTICFVSRLPTYIIEVFNIGEMAYCRFGFIFMIPLKHFKILA